MIVRGSVDIVKRVCVHAQGERSIALFTVRGTLLRALDNRLQIFFVYEVSQTHTPCHTVTKWAAIYTHVTDRHLNRTVLQLWPKN